MAQKSKSERREPPQIMLKADSLTLTAAADKEGKIRLSCASWAEPATLLEGQIAEVRWQNGQVVLLRRAL